MHTLRFKSGFTTCPACSLLGIPQEPYNAVPTVDDRVFCYQCNRVTSPISEANRYRIFPTIQALPKPILDIVMALISDEVKPDGAVSPTYAIVNAGSKGLGFSNPMTEDDMQRAAGAVACGNADVLIDEADRVTIQLSHGPYSFHTASVSFKANTLNVGSLSADDRCDLAAPLLDRLNGPEARVVRELSARGFTYGGTDLDSSMRFVRMSNGSEREGIAVEIHWIP